MKGYGVILFIKLIHLLQKFLEHALLEKILLGLFPEVSLIKIYLIDVDYLLRLLVQEKMGTG